MLVIVGILLGTLSATVSESFFHMFFGHPFESAKKLYYKNTALFAACLKPYYQHYVIHHKKTYLNHFFKQFDSLEHKQRVDSWIAENFDEDFKNLIWIERYNLTLKGFIGTLPFAGPFCIGPALVYYFLGTEAFLGCLLTAYIPVWMSKYIHPLIHAPEDTHKQGPFIRWFMKTAYAEKVLLNHFLHHNNGNKNFNLFLGGDQLIGLHRNATPKELEDYNTLLIEFRYKVRNEVKVSYPKETSNISSLRQELVKEYCQRGSMLTRDRHAFQKRLFSFNKVNADSSSDYEGFGFSLYSKEIDYKKWTKRKEFSLEAYSTQDGAIFYRGNLFRTGDILLTNQASDADGLFSTLLEREINFAHAAVFINLEYNSKIFPAVLEINEYGTRAVPLKSFLSKDFNSYIEVFSRNIPIDETQASALSLEALTFLKETHAFDIYQDRQQNHYLNCARTIELLYKRSNIELIIGDSRYHQATYPNLHTLGIQDSIGKDLLMPDDYALCSDFKLTGAIANSALEQMLARNLTRAYFQRIWRTRLLEKSTFPMAEKIKGLMIELIQKNNALSQFILFFLGMTYQEFPSGPATFMSLVTYGDSQMMSAVKSVRDELEANWSELYSELEWDELLDHPKIQEVMTKATSGFCEIFRPEYESSMSLSFGSKLV